MNTLMKTPNNLDLESITNIRSLLPADLRDWLGAAALAAAARAAAENFYWISADDDDPPPFGGCGCPVRKLALFTYCYAAGLLSTSQMEAGLANDETLREIYAQARFSTDQLRLFRAHNSELIKLCLARVWEQAWAAKFGATDGLRDLCAAEAEHRFRYGVEPDRRPAVVMAGAGEMDQRPGSGATPSPRDAEVGRGQGEGFWHGARTARPRGPRLADRLSALLRRAALWLAVPMLPVLARAAEVSPPPVFPALFFGGVTNTHVRVVRVTPSKVIVMYDGGGSSLSRSNLPPELQALYPYDHEAAVAYEAEQQRLARIELNRQRREARRALLAEERDLETRLDKTREAIIDAQKEYRRWHGKPRGTYGQIVAMDEIERKKLGLEQYRALLERQLEAVRRQLLLNPAPALETEAVR